MYFWTWPKTFFGLALSLIGAGLAVVAYSAGWAIAEDCVGYSSAVFLLSVIGRLVTMRNLRWKGVSELVPASAKVRNGRVVIRKFLVFPWIMLVIVGAAWIFAVSMWWAGDSTADAVAILIAATWPLAVLFGIPTLAPKVVVTPTHLCIDGAITRTRIPRQAMQAVRLVESGAISVEVSDQSSIVVYRPAERYRREWDPRPGQLEFAGRLKAALEAVPRAPAESDLVVNERRPLVIALAVLAAVTFTTLAVLARTGVVE